jgi:hypothetical protein
MENIYTILEKLNQVTNRAVIEGEIPAGLKAYQDKKPGKKSDDKDTKASNGKMPMDAGKDGKMGTKDDKPAFLKKESVAKDNMQEDDGIFADTALSMDKLAKLKEVEETASTIRTQLKDAMMSRLAELAGVPLAEIEEAVGESTQDAASRIKSEVVLDDEEVKEGDDFMSTDPKGAWKAIAARKEELVDQGMEPEEAQDQAAEEIGVDPEELEAWLAINEGDDFMSTDPKGAWKAIAARKEELMDNGMEPEEAQDQAAEEIGVDPEELEAWLATNESVDEAAKSDTMVCKHCGDHMGKPTTDCECDCNDENGDHWVEEEEVKETTSAGAMAVDASGGGKALYKNASVYESNDIIRASRRLMEGMNINISLSDQGAPSLSVSATDEDAMQLASLLNLAGLGGFNAQQTAVAEDQEFANGADNTATADTETLVNTISGGLNAQHQQINPNNKGDNPMAMQNIKNNTVNIGPGKDIDEDLTESHLMTLYKKFKSK